MSLQSLTALRVKHHVKPMSVWVIVGDAPAWIEDAPSIVIVKPGAKDFDFRAFVGLQIDVIAMGDDWPTLDRVLTAIDDANPKSTSISGPAGTVGLNEEHARCLDRARRLICNS